MIGKNDPVRDWIDSLDDGRSLHGEAAVLKRELPAIIAAKLGCPVELVQVKTRVRGLKVQVKVTLEE